jgi:hypothetical protein
VNQLKVGGFILEIDGNGAVFPRRFGSLSHVSPKSLRSRMLMRHDGDNALKFQENRARVTASPLNPLECAGEYSIELGPTLARPCTVIDNRNLCRSRGQRRT